jgi:hypothetical protein
MGVIPCPAPPDTTPAASPRCASTVCRFRSAYSSGVASPGAPLALAPVRPHLVRLPFKANPGRWAGWLFITGFVGSTVIAGGEVYGAW